MPKNISRDPRILKIQRLIRAVEGEHGISISTVLELAKGIRVPVAAFASGLSSFEVIVKYLHEEKELGMSVIAKLTGRSRQAVWITYRRAVKKFPKKLDVTPSSYDFSLEILGTANRPVLASIVAYLKDVHALSYAEIGRMLLRDQRTIWTVYNAKRVKRKN